MRPMSQDIRGAGSKDVGGHNSSTDSGGHSKGQFAVRALDRIAVDSCNISHVPVSVPELPGTFTTNTKLTQSFYVGPLVKQQSGWWMEVASRTGLSKQIQTGQVMGWIHNSSN